MKKYLVLIIALLAASFEMSAQYARPGTERQDVRQAGLTPASFSDSSAAVPDFSKGLSQKRTGTALLASAGACTAVGAVLFGLSWTLVSDSVPDAARSIPIIGVSLLGAAVPLYIAGSVLYVKGKKATVEFAPGAVAIRF